MDEKRGLRAWVTAAALGVTAIGTVAGIAAALGVAYARLVVTPARRQAEPVVVTEIERDGDELVVWLRGPDANLPGQYSLLFDGDEGHARVGRLRASRGSEVARNVLTVDRGQLREGVPARITGWWYTNPEELGYRTERIAYPTELGDAEAWIIRPRWNRKRRWSIHVHGRGARPEETLRGVAPLLRAGITCMVIAYRNDAGAPASESGRYGIGVSEARDVDAAIAEAVRRGAERVTLFGWSMGGTACLLAATRGRFTRLIDGLLLDSPAVDWRSLLVHQAHLNRLPAPIADFSIDLLASGRVRSGDVAGLPMNRLAPEAFAEDLAVPVLIHASEEDGFVPCAGSQELARLRPDLVDLRLADTGGHVKIWNVDPEPWEAAVQQFAATLPAPPWRG